MHKTEILSWIKTSYLPLCFATPDAVISQKIEEAVLYWNNHSAYKILRMVDATGVVVDVTSEIKTVVYVYPATLNVGSGMGGGFASDLGYWAFLGGGAYGPNLSDLILMNEAYKNYYVYFGGDFSWTFVRSENSKTSGKLYTRNLPSNSSRLCLVGTKRIFDNEDITDEVIYNWIRQYAKALTYEHEGNLLRKGSIIGITGNDGNPMVDDARNDKEKLEQKLMDEGRWLAFSKTLGSYRS